MTEVNVTPPDQTPTDGLLAAIPDDMRAALPGPRCTIARIRGRLGPLDRDKFDRMMDPESGWTHAELARKLAPALGKIDQGTIGHHRRGDCACDRTAA